MKNHISPFSFVPKYYQLAEILNQKIEDGEWNPHESIPSERELVELYKVSRTTVREALNYLEKEGVIYRKHGQGTFVARPKMQHSLQRLTSFSIDMSLRQQVPGQKILSFDYVTPSDKIRNRLELSSNQSEVLYIKRVRYGNEDPIAIHMAFLVLDPEQTITVDELETSGSLYQLLESKFHIIPNEADETIEAALVTEEEAELLEVQEGSPVLVLERTTSDQEHRIFEYVKMIVRADRYKCYIHMTR
jgi:GntR family transcriptional regulator